MNAASAKDSLPTGDEKVRVVRAMFDAIAPQYERSNRLISMGLDGPWRRAAIERAFFEPGSTILDIASGTGDFCRLLEKAGHFPVAVDLSYGMLESARIDSPKVQADGLKLPFADASVDGITCGFALRNVVDLDGLFVELARVVRPNGRISLLDAAQPDNKIVSLGHDLWFNRTVPKIGGLLSKTEAYSYLPKSLAYLPEPTKMLSMLRAARFNNLKRDTFLFGSAQLFTATRVVDS